MAKASSYRYSKADLMLIQAVQKQDLAGVGKARQSDANSNITDPKTGKSVLIMALEFMPTDPPRSTAFSIFQILCQSASIRIESLNSALDYSKTAAVSEEAQQMLLQRMREVSGHIYLGSLKRTYVDKNKRSFCEPLEQLALNNELKKAIISNKPELASVYLKQGAQSTKIVINDLFAPFWVIKNNKKIELFKELLKYLEVGEDLLFDFSNFCKECGRHDIMDYIATIELPNPAHISKRSKDSPEIPSMSPLTLEQAEARRSRRRTRIRENLTLEIPENDGEKIAYSYVESDDYSGRYWQDKEMDKSLNPAKNKWQKCEVAKSKQTNDSPTHET